jgi:hypothetical protein
MFFIETYIPNNLWGRLQSQQYFFECFYYYFIPTTCLDPYGPSSGAQFLGAIYATAVPLFLTSYQFYIY